MTRVECMIRTIVRRLTGRSGTGPAVTRHRMPSPVDMQMKARNAERAARDARKAVDSFTAGVEQAMRGQRT